MSHEVKRFRGIDHVGIDGYTSHPPAEDGAGSAGEHGCRGFLSQIAWGYGSVTTGGTCLRPNA